MHCWVINWCYHRTCDAGDIAIATLIMLFLRLQESVGCSTWTCFISKREHISLTKSDVGEFFTPEEIRIEIKNINNRRIFVKSILDQFNVSYSCTFRIVMRSDRLQLSEV